MDDIDRRIANVLQENARLSFRKIAEVIGVTTATVSSRVKEMEHEGIIRKYTVLLDYEILEKTTLLLTVDADLSRIGEIVEPINELPEVCCILRVTGGADLVIVVKCDGRKGARQVLDTLTCIEGVRNVTSQVVLETIKESLCVKL